jgi:hypothetical protein
VQVKVEVPADPARVSRLIREVHARSFRRYRLFGIALAVAGVGYLAWSVIAGRSGTPVFAAVLLLAGAALYLALPALLVRRSRDGSSKLTGRAWTYVLSDRGLLASSVSSREELGWEAFERARETGDHFLLHLSKLQVVGIPHGGMTPAEREAVRSLLQSRELLPTAVGRG